MLCSLKEYPTSLLVTKLDFPFCVTDSLLQNSFMERAFTDHWNLLARIRKVASFGVERYPSRDPIRDLSYVVYSINLAEQGLLAHQKQVSPKYSRYHGFLLYAHFMATVLLLLT